MDSITLKLIDETFNNRISRAVRLKLAVGVVYELLNARRDILNNLCETDNVTEEDATEKEITENRKYEDGTVVFSGKIAVYRDNRYPIFDCDYGQCQMVRLNNSWHSMGTYTTFDEYKADIGFLAEDAYTDAKMTELYGPDWAKQVY